VINVAHVITGLDTGGAEMMLLKLVSGIDSRSFHSSVISLTDVGPVGERIRSLGVPVCSMGMRRDVPDVWALLRLMRRLRNEAPQVVQTWMYHADLVGGVAARLARRSIAIAWNVQAGHLVGSPVRRRTLSIVRTCARLSRWVPDRIVCCGDMVRRMHRESGYADSKIEVIPNGTETAVFKPDPVARASFRRELGAEDRDVVVGIPARFDPMKDHRTFIEAAGMLLAERPEARFVLCGDNMTEQNTTLNEWLGAARVRARCHLLGRRDDMPRVYAGLDVASLSSAYGEGCPNAIGEAMACGVPCVVTDVGDCRHLVGETGGVVPVRSPALLAAAWRELVDGGPLAREALGHAARRRIERHYDIATIVRRYEGLYRDLARASRTVARAHPAPRNAARP
jgi:glycosyltransferase involved in cell wall biosynthesis